MIRVGAVVATEQLSTDTAAVAIVVVDDLNARTAEARGTISARDTLPIHREQETKRAKVSLSARVRVHHLYVLVGEDR